MGEWWTYGLSDFLLFSPRTYYRLFELYNAAVWPLQIGTIVLGVVLLAAAVKGGLTAQRLVYIGLALCWLWVAWGFFHQHYATINWAADYVAAAFVAQAGLLLFFGCQRQIARHRPKFETTAWLGIAFLVVGVILYPLLGLASGRPLSQAEVFGLAPDPTVIATLGALLVVSVPGRLVLQVVPFLWCMISAATLWTMGEPYALLLPVAAVIGVTSSAVSRS